MVGGPVGPPFEHDNGRRQRARRVGEREADATGAKVDTQHSSETTPRPSPRRAGERGGGPVACQLQRAVHLVGVGTAADDGLGVLRRSASEQLRDGRRDLGRRHSAVDEVLGDGDRDGRLRAVGRNAPHQRDDPRTGASRVATAIGGGQVNTASGDYVFGMIEAYLIENGEITEPLRQGNLIGNGPQTLLDIDMLGDDFAMGGPGTCGKDGQGVPVGTGQPTLRVKALTIGGSPSSTSTPPAMGERSRPIR